MGENIATIDRSKQRKGIVLECRDCRKEVSAVLKSIEFENVGDYGSEKTDSNSRFRMQERPRNPVQPYTKGVLRDFTP